MLLFLHQVSNPALRSNVQSIPETQESLFQMDLGLSTCGGLSTRTTHGLLGDRDLRGDGDLDTLRLRVYRLGDGDLERPRSMYYRKIRSAQILL